MVDMAVREPDLLDRDAGLLDRFQDFGTSPPGSITTAFLEGSCQMMVQFCSNSVTGTIIAPALALVSALLWSCQQIADFCAAPREEFAEESGG
jgi:hypothetical protein